MNDTMVKALRNWTTFNELLNTLAEYELKELLKYEIEHENRKSFVERLHQRYNILRVMRERETLMKGYE